MKNKFMNVGIAAISFTAFMSAAALAQQGSANSRDAMTGERFKSEENQNPPGSGLTSAGEQGGSNPPGSGLTGAGGGAPAPTSGVIGGSVIPSTGATPTATIVGAPTDGGRDAKTGQRFKSEENQNPPGSGLTSAGEQGGSNPPGSGLTGAGAAQTKTGG